MEYLSTLISHTTTAFGKHLQVVSAKQVRIEMVIGAWLAVGLLLFYYVRKIRNHERLDKNAGRTIASALFAVFMFTIVLVLIP